MSEKDFVKTLHTLTETKIRKKNASMSLERKTLPIDSYINISPNFSPHLLLQILYSPIISPLKSSYLTEKPCNET